MKKEEWLRLKAKRDAVRAKRVKEIDDTRIIVSRFVKVIAPKGGPKVPLMIGITEDIFQRIVPTVPVMSKRLLKQMMADYTQGPSYLRALVAGAKRVDMDGRPVGVVTQDQERRAREMLAEIDAKREAAAARKRNKPKQKRKAA